MGLPLLFPLTQLPAPSSPALLPQGEKGANHGDHMLQTVQLTSLFAPAPGMIPICLRSRASDYASLIEPTVSKQAASIRTDRPP